MSSDSSPALLVDRLAWERKPGSPVSFAVAPGERVYVCGEAASALLLAVAGFVPHQCARLACDGRDLRGIAPGLRHLAYLPAGDTLLARRSVLGNVRLGGASREAAMAALDRLGMLEHARSPAAALTPGQRRRVALARSLAVQPALLLVEEGADDPPAIPESLSGLARPAALIATRQPGLALARADRILLLHDGDITQFASPRDIYERPATQAAARWAGDCTFVPVTLDGEGGLPGSVAARFGPHSVAGRFRDRLRGDAVLAIRPHRLRIDPAGLPATITRIEYRGATTRVTLNAHGVAFCLDMARSDGLREGDPVGVAWDWADAWPVSP